MIAYMFQKRPENFAFQFAAIYTWNLLFSLEVAYF